MLFLIKFLFAFEETLNESLFKAPWLVDFSVTIGDFNVIPAAEDVYNAKNFEDDALYRLEIRKKFREMLNLGFSDVYRHFNETKEGYTFWDYMRGAWQKNNGMRIDHFLVSSSLIDKIKSININKDPRGREKPSDHTPIEITLT